MTNQSILTHHNSAQFHFDWWRASRVWLAVATPCTCLLPSASSGVVAFIAGVVHCGRVLAGSSGAVAAAVFPSGPEARVRSVFDINPSGIASNGGTGTGNAAASSSCPFMRRRLAATRAFLWDTPSCNFEPFPPPDRRCAKLSAQVHLVAPRRARVLSSPLPPLVQRPTRDKFAVTASRPVRRSRRRSALAPDRPRQAKRVTVTGGDR